MAPSSAGGSPTPSGSTPRRTGRALPACGSRRRSKPSSPGALRDLGALYEPLSRPTVPADEVKAGLDRVRAARHAHRDRPWEDGMTNRISIRGAASCPGPRGRHRGEGSEDALVALACAAFEFMRGSPAAAVRPSRFPRRSRSRRREAPQEASVISGAMRGKGGRALSAHLLKAENEHVRVIEPRGLGSADLHAQLEELVVLSLGGRTDKAIYHVHVDPELTVADNPGARAMWWRLFEHEFGLAGQPYCGAEHVKHGRAHEHRCYSLVRPSGQVVDLAIRLRAPGEGQTGSSSTPSGRRRSGLSTPASSSAGSARTAGTTWRTGSSRPERRRPPGR